MINPWSGYFELVQAAWDANIVVALRLSRLAAGGALAQREAQRMIVEKGLTLTEAQLAAASKLVAGGGLVAAAKTGSRIYRKKLRSNRRRLVRRSLTTGRSPRRGVTE